MKIKGNDTVLSILLLAICVLGCSKSSREANSNSSSPSAKPTAATIKTNADGTIPSGTGVEKEKPAPDKGNVQGKAFFNEKPAENVEVKLCEKFSQFLSGCGGEVFTTRTDSQGEYLVKDVPPRTYEGLTVKVFNTNYYVFATAGIAQTAKYKIEAGQTFFAPDTHLFKNDLKLYVYPLLEPATKALITAANLRVESHLQHLYDYLIQNRSIESLRDVRKECLPIFSRDVLEQIKAGRREWEEMVPPEVAQIIKERRLLDCQPS